MVSKILVLKRKLVCTTAPSIKTAKPNYQTGLLVGFIVGTAVGAVVGKGQAKTGPLE